MRFKALILLSLFIFVSCKTYTIPTDSFKEQFTKTEQFETKEVQINNPLLYGNLSYKANNIKNLLVRDKEGNFLTIPNSPSLEMRITHKNGKRYIFYFDTVVLENDILKASRSRFIPSLTKSIPLDSISKIEVQEGGKNFKYKN
ncbi:MAG: hypothetical protein E2604_17785 [Flavobacterium sp.]|jgi:hypothetical protein|nr:hypothetical protein [Flavobacterium sp.]